MASIFFAGAAAVSMVAFLMKSSFGNAFCR